MGRTACTEPQSLYKGALYTYLYFLRCFSHMANAYSIGSTTANGSLKAVVYLAYIN